jgi:hypothetical protein
MTNHRTLFLTIRAEGALLPVDLLQRILENDNYLVELQPDALRIYGYLPEA